MPALAPPLRGQLKVTSPYGPRADGFHTGTDYSARIGTLVLAAAAGFARRVSNVGGGRGVAIDHGDGMSTEYWHLNAQAIPATGRSVRQGDIIGYSGASGAMVTGPHLHFEVKVNGQVVDPETVLAGGIGNPSPSAGHITTIPPGGCPPGYVPARLAAPFVVDVPIVGATPIGSNIIEAIGRPGEPGNWNVCLLESRGYRVGDNPWGVGETVEGAAHEVGEGLAQGLSDAVPLLLNIGAVVLAVVVGWQGVKNVLAVD